MNLSFFPCSPFLEGKKPLKCAPAKAIYLKIMFQPLVQRYFEVSVTTYSVSQDYFVCRISFLKTNDYLFFFLPKEKYKCLPQDENVICYVVYRKL